MKLNKSVFAASTGLVLAALLISGCAETPKITFESDVAGEIKLTGVSKIALANFNSMPGDPFAGVVAADKETCALVRRAVGSAFYKLPMFQISDLDFEAAIHSADNTKLVDHRFDAFLYGRLWWQLTPETKGQLPKKETLTTTRKFVYKVTKTEGKGDKKKTVTTNVPIILPIEKRDVLQMMDYNARSATLMLSLSLYRVDHSGDVTKVTDIYQVTENGFVLQNGQITTSEQDVGVADGQKTAVAGGASKGSGNDQVTGKVILEKTTVAMPTELQAKLMLASNISSKLAAKLAPSKKKVELEPEYVYDSGFGTFFTTGSWSFGDERLCNLLLKGAFDSAHDYSLYMLRNKLGKEICEKLSEFVPELGEEAPYPIPPSTEKLTQYDDTVVDSLVESGLTLYSFTLGTAHGMARELGNKADCYDELVSYLSGEDLDIYFYGLGLTHEVAHRFDAAEECYRLAFNVNPTKESAEGIQRARASLGEAARIMETRRAKKKAEKKTRVN